MGDWDYPRGPPFGKSTDKGVPENPRFGVFQELRFFLDVPHRPVPVGNLNTIPSRLLAELEALTECSLKTGEFQ